MLPAQAAQGSGVYTGPPAPAPSLQLTRSGNKGTFAFTHPTPENGVPASQVAAACVTSARTDTPVQGCTQCPPVALRSVKRHLKQDSEPPPTVRSCFLTIGEGDRPLMRTSGDRLVWESGCPAQASVGWAGIAS